MVQGDFQALSATRAARARLLASRYPAARHALIYYGEIASFQATVDPDHPLAARRRLIELVLDHGTPLLKDAARDLGETACREAMEAYREQRDIRSPRSFFARVLLQPAMWARAPSRQPASPSRCPGCGHPPQVGCLRALGHGAALSLICSLCFAEFPFSRGRCPACNENDEKKVAYYSAAEMEHLKIQTCESCGKYLHTVSLAKDPEAVPDVDEIAALPLDVWAQEKGFSKLQPNLIGV